MNSKKIKELLKDENKYCHISTRLDFNGEFVKRVPTTRTAGENNTIERVCVASTIEGALTAIPNGGMRLDTYKDVEYIFKLCIIDTEKLGITDEDIIKSDMLYETGMVPDAHLTEESWITKSFKINEEDMFIIKLNSWEEESHDLFSYDIQVAAETEYDDDIYEAFNDLVGGNIPCITGITELDFISENLVKGQSFNFDERSLRDYQLEKLTSNLQNIDVRNNYGEIEIEANKDTNVKDVLVDIYNNLFGYYE